MDHEKTAECRRVPTRAHRHKPDRAAPVGDATHGVGRPRLDGHVDDDAHDRRAHRAARTIREPRTLTDQELAQLKADAEKQAQIDDADFDPTSVAAAPNVAEFLDRLEGRVTAVNVLVSTVDRRRSTRAQELPRVVRSLDR